MSLIEKVCAANPNADQIINSTPINDTPEDLLGLLNKIIGWIIYIGAILAFIYLVVSGITYITAGGNAEQAKKGLTGVINSVIGIVVMVLSFAILKAVSGIFK